MLLLQLLAVAVAAAILRADFNMIRLADHKDTKIIVELLRKFLTETSYEQAEAAANDREHLCKLIWTVQQHGWIWLAFADERPAGLLMATKEPNLWYPKAHEMRELVWYVVPEHRNSSLGGKLFLAYCKKAEELRQAGSIQGYFTTRMPTTEHMNLERRGFKLKEMTYLKD